MTDDPDLIVLLARGGKLANRIADAVSELVRQGAELGELERREITDGDQPRTVLAVPAIWVDRLRDAAVRGAFERLTVNEIVGRILTTPAPSESAGAMG